MVLTLPITAGIVIAWEMWALRPATWLATMTLQGPYQLYDYNQGQHVYPQLLVTVLTVFYLNHWLPENSSFISNLPSVSQARSELRAFRHPLTRG
jgi:hypothetical protein